MSQYRDASKSEKKIDMVGHFIMRKGLFQKGKITFIVHQVFLDYMKTLDESTKQGLMNELSEQAVERFQMLNDSNNAFYGDEEGFEHYRSVKYKNLYQHIANMLAIAWGQK
jgi:hypothetical protein